MDNNNSLNFQDLLKLRRLSSKNSEIYVTGLSVKDFSDPNHLGFLTRILKHVLETTEQTCTLRILFKESKKELVEYPFKTFELIFVYFYTVATQTRCLENKNFFVVFPQLLQNQFQTVEEINLKVNMLIDLLIVTVNLTDHHDNNLNGNNLFNITSTDYSNFKSSDDEQNINKILLQKSQKATQATRDDLKLFSYDGVALGGSFDHSHIGHNVNYSLIYIDSINNSSITN